MSISSFINNTEYIRAACDFQLSSSETQLLSTFLSEEDQYNYNSILKVHLPEDILQLLNQVRSFYFNYNFYSSKKNFYL